MASKLRDTSRADLLASARASLELSSTRTTRVSASRALLAERADLFIDRSSPLPNRRRPFRRAAVLALVVVSSAAATAGAAAYYFEKGPWTPPPPPPPLDLSDIELTLIENPTEAQAAAIAQTEEINKAIIAAQKAKAEADAAAAKAQAEADAAAAQGGSSPGGSSGGGGSGGGSGSSGGGGTQTPAPYADSLSWTGASGAGYVDVTAEVHTTGSTSVTVTLTVDGQTITLNGPGTVNGWATYTGRIDGLTPGEYIATVRVSAKLYSSKTLHVY